MKQVLQRADNGDISIPEVPDPKLLPGSVLVRVSASLVSAGTERASAEFAEAQRLSANHYPTIASLKAGRYFGVPTIRALYETTFFVGLRKAGMPEE